MKSIVTSESFDYMGENLSKELDIKKADIKVQNFADGWPHIQIVEEDVKNKVVTVLLDSSNSEDFFLNYSLLQGLVNYKTDSLNIVMPYFPVGTMERVGKKGEVATAHSFANIMSGLPTGKSGRKNNLNIIDIHAEVEEFLFSGNNINVEASSAMSLLAEVIKGKIVVFPDEGAAKRFGNNFPDSDKVICSKVRKGDKRVVEIKEGNPEGKDLIIIDDLIQTGGTIIETSELLKSLGAKSVTSYATHGVFSNDSHIGLSKAVDKLIVTDSIPANNKRAEDVDNMEIISIESLVKEIIINN